MKTMTENDIAHRKHDNGARLTIAAIPLPSASRPATTPATRNAAQIDPTSMAARKIKPVMDRNSLTFVNENRR
jgi:hypothetical protein